MWLSILVVSISFISLFVNLIIFFKISKFKKLKIKNFFRKNEIYLSEYEEFISQLTTTLLWFCKKKVGALIVVEKNHVLEKYIKMGYSVSAKFASEFLINIFYNKSSALHDGAVILRGFNIVAVSSYVPITTNRMTTSYGARHRAATGITEHTDAISLVVSETSGKLSYSIGGKLFEISENNDISLASKLFEIFSFYIK